MRHPEEDLLAEFEAATIDREAFGHRNHLRVAWALLGPQGAPFHDAYIRLRRGLITLCALDGHPERYSETQTLGWLAVVHQAIAEHPGADSFDALEQAAGPAFARDALARRYGETLSNPASRVGLVLPPAGAIL